MGNNANNENNWQPVKTPSGDWNIANVGQGEGKKNQQQSDVSNTQNPALEPNY